MEGRIDVIGAGLEADDVDAAALERAQETERDGRLAAAERGAAIMRARVIARPRTLIRPFGPPSPGGEGIAGRDVAPPLPRGEGWGEGRARERGGLARTATRSTP